MQKLGSGISEQTELINSNNTMLICLVGIQVSRLRHLMADRFLMKQRWLSKRKMRKLNSILALILKTNYSRTSLSSQ